MSTLAFSRAVSILVCSLGIASALVGDAASQGLSSRPLVSEAQFEAWQTELSNWGRWGRDDELGTLNLITPPKRQGAFRSGEGRRTGNAQSDHSRQASGGIRAGEGGSAGVLVDEYVH